MVTRFHPEDTDMLLVYLQKLGELTRQRFSPHPFDRQSIIDLYADPELNTAFIAFDPSSCEIIAYAVLRKGIPGHDLERLCSYGILPDHKTDCIFAPSVADERQGTGIGQKMFEYICQEVKFMGIRRIILWGGVQCSNNRAVQYYIKNGFRVLGRFDYNGCNYDMIREQL